MYATRSKSKQKMEKTGGNDIKMSWSVTDPHGDVEEECSGSGS